jgi:hypothetical protein
MVPLAVSGLIVLSVSIGSALVLMFFLLRSEAREDAAKKRAEADEQQ